MEEITDQNRIWQMIREKQALEVMLSLDMLEIFNDRNAGLIGKIRDLVGAAIEDMDRKRTSNTVDFDKKWNGNWNKYAGCSDHGISNWDKTSIQHKARNFRAEHCADWIRIFGEVVEDVTKGKDDAKRQSYQKGGEYHWSKYPKKGNLDYGKDLPEKGRRRYEHTDKQFPLKNPLFEKEPTPAWEVLSSMPAAGIKKWAIMEKDTVGKMDQLFGLTPGATISGTTTDNIFFIDKFAKMRIDPIYYLLPTATIAGGGHHTLLEVALPLALNNLIKYEIGLYSTLFPDRKGLPAEPSGVREMKLLLGTYEAHEYNHLMLIYYRQPAQPEGCFLYDKISDKKRWQEFAKADERLMQKFKIIPKWPKKKDVKGLPYL
jgi:hypothetical protein